MAEIGLIAALGARLARGAADLRDRWSARRAALFARATVLRAAPAPLTAGDEKRASRAAAGALGPGAGGVASPGASPFAETAPTPAWVAAAHGFGWLDDAQAAGKADRLALRAWVFDWLRQFGDGGGPGWRPEFAGRRLAHLVAASPLLLRGASDADRSRLLRGIDAHLRFLAARAPAAEPGLARIESAAGLALGGLASAGGDTAARVGARLLGAAAAESIDGDGGLPSRDPEMLGRAFALLAWAADALRDAGLAPDPRHIAAMARAGQAVRALRLSDGGLPWFHGGGGGIDAALDEAFARAGGPATRGARRTGAMGFARMSAGRAVALIDAAPPPPTGVAGASTLALAFSHGDQRLFDAVGPGAALGDDWAVAARATAAHSAVEIGGVSAARLGPRYAAGRTQGRRFRQGPERVGLERTRDVDGDWLLADHDGYAARFGLMVIRRLRLAPDGCDLRCEDVVAATDLRSHQRLDKATRAGPLAFCVRFHLADGVAAQIDDAQSAALRLSDGAEWTMRVEGGALRRVDSMRCTPDCSGTQPAQQLVIVATAQGRRSRIAWALTLTHPKPASRDGTVRNAR